MRLIEKIDAEIKERKNASFIQAYSMEVEKEKSHNQGEIKGLELAKQIILSEQKEPYIAERVEAKKYLQEIKKCCTGCDYENVETDIVPCCICNRLYEDEFRPKKLLTIGDKIRESNESLAEWIYNHQNIPQQPIGDSMEYILDYLNQKAD